MNDDYTLTDQHGHIHDKRIEAMLSLTVQGQYDTAEYEAAFNGIVREFLTPDAPHFATQRLDRGDAMVLTYIVALGYDFIVVNNQSTLWPGAFDYMPGAHVACSICYKSNPYDGCGYSPGHTLNQAGLMALMQLAREHSEERRNQKRLI